ncbi:MAG TPA: substrate-binding domain-containing protein [Vineibacter sp.]|nr:substrate-binding domain-containing protein [Vineibacter sp.]
MRHLSRRALLASTLASALPRLAWAQAEEIRVISSGGFTAAYNILAPRFEKMTGKKIVSAYGASMGNAPDAIPQRLARGEPTDIIILARSALDEFAARGVVRPDSRVDLAESRIGVAVRAGATKPDVSTVDALRRTLLAASTIAYSASASGVYVSTELYKRLGIEAEVMPKSRRILSERVAAVVARGEAEIGFQQISEIIGVPGAELVGPLPADVQRVTVFSAGVLTDAPQPDAAAALIRFLSSADADETIASTGLDPIKPR